MGDKTGFPRLGHNYCTFNIVNTWYYLYSISRHTIVCRAPQVAGVQVATEVPAR